MKTKNGQVFRTIVDAASDLGISADTLRRYIRNGTLPRPPVEFFGQTGVKVFPEEYMQRAKMIGDGFRQPASP